jgi:hypothetical protein
LPLRETAASLDVLAMFVKEPSTSYYKLLSCYTNCMALKAIRQLRGKKNTQINSGVHPGPKNSALLSSAIPGGPSVIGVSLIRPQWAHWPRKTKLRQALHEPSNLTHPSLSSCHLVHYFIFNITFNSALTPDLTA